MKRIDRIITLFYEEESKVCAEMNSCQDYYSEQLRILNDLHEYEREYKKNHTAILSSGITIERINNFNNFMARLKLTIKQQSLNVESAQAKLECVRMKWQTAMKRRKMLDKLNTRLDTKSRIKDLQYEQKELDESVSAMFYLKKHD